MSTVSADLRVVLPVQALKVIGRQHVDLTVTRDVSVVRNILRVARFEKAFHGLDAVAGLRELFARELERALLFASFRQRP